MVPYPTYGSGEFHILKSRRKMASNCLRTVIDKSHLLFNQYNDGYIPSIREIGQDLLLQTWIQVIELPLSRRPFELVWPFTDNNKAAFQEQILRSNHFLASLHYYMATVKFIMKARNKQDSLRISLVTFHWLSVVGNCDRSCLQAKQFIRYILLENCTNYADKGN